MSTREAPKHLWDVMNNGASEESKYAAFEEIVINYQYLVEATARKLSHRLPSFLEVDEMISLGQIGLLRAIGKYEVSQGPFSRYASTVIWGAIIDGLRADDFAPRGLRKQQRDLEKATTELQDEGTASPTDLDLAEHLGWEETAIGHLRKRVVKAEVAPTDPSLMPGVQQAEAGEGMWSNDMCKDFVVWLQGWELPTQEIVLLKYWKGLSLRTISELMNLPAEQVRARHQKVLTDLLPFMVELATDTQAGL